MGRPFGRTMTLLASDLGRRSGAKRSSFRCRSRIWWSTADTTAFREGNVWLPFLRNSLKTISSLRGVQFYLTSFRGQSPLRLIYRIFRPTRLFWKGPLFSLPEKAKELIRQDPDIHLGLHFHESLSAAPGMLYDLLTFQNETWPAEAINV